MSNMGPGRKGAGSRASRCPGVLGRPLLLRGGGRSLTLPCPAADNYSTLNEMEHSRTLERPGDLGDTEPVKAAPLMVSSSSRGAKSHLGRGAGDGTPRGGRCGPPRLTLPASPH